jgi:ketosteroid isomerase-like protein
MSIPGPQPHRHEQNKQIAAAFLAAIATGDMETIERLLHPQLRWWVQGFGEFDRTRFVASLRATIARSSERSMHIGGITAEGDRVAVEAVGRFQLSATVYSNTYHYLFVICDGLIRTGKEYLDTREAARVFGGGTSTSGHPSLAPAGTSDHP